MAGTTTQLLWQTERTGRRFQEVSYTGNYLLHRKQLCFHSQETQWLYLLSLAVDSLLYVSFLVTCIFLPKNLDVPLSGIVHLSHCYWPISLRISSSSITTTDQPFWRYGLLIVLLKYTPHFVSPFTCCWALGCFHLWANYECCCCCGCCQCGTADTGTPASLPLSGHSD